ncbi:unnamed protein product [Merluccius merluccius]
MGRAGSHWSRQPHRQTATSEHRPVPDGGQRRTRQEQPFAASSPWNQPAAQQPKLSPMHRGGRWGDNASSHLGEGGPTEG